MLRVIGAFISILILAGCAQQGVVSGGPRDTTPPKVITSSVESGSVNFTGKEIEFTFDEYVTVQGLGKYFISSPPLNNPLEFKIKGKSVTFIINDTLRSNATYNFYFGDAIADVNEGNKWKENRFVFSTGAAIDSLKIAGKVVNAATNELVKDAFVLLYNSQSDSVVSKEKPMYLGKSDATGHFEMGYLAPGKYKVCALIDENGNYKFDSEKEQFAFLDTMVLIQPTSEINDLVLKLFPPEVKEWNVNKKYFSNNQLLQLNINRPVEALELDFLGMEDTLSIYPIYAKQNDTIQVWFDQPLVNDFQMLVTAEGKTDTLSLVPGRAAGLSDSDFKLAIKSKSKLPVQTNNSLKFNAPILALDTQKIQLWKDTLLVPMNWSPLVKGANQYDLGTFKKTGKYRLVVDKNAFQSFNGLSNDSVDFTFQVNGLDQYGIIDFNLVFPTSSQYVAQLTMGKSGVIAEQTGQDSLSWKQTLLTPGNYQLLIFEDVNRNGKWDTGDYYQKRQPEKKYIYHEKIQVRANWDMEVRWEIVNVEK